MLEDDLATLFAQPTDATVVTRFGRIISWNAENFDNVIELAPTVRVENMPLVSGADALSFEPGNIVELRGLDGGGGVQSWWIAGRLIRPGTGNAEAAINFMRGNLARQLSAEILSDRFKAEVDPFAAERVSNSYGDPDGAFGDPGPAVIGEVSAGIAVVWIAAAANSDSGQDTPTPSKAGSISVEVSGATSIDASNANRARISLNQVLLSTDSRYNVDATVGAPIVFTGLNPGEHTFTMKYRDDGDTSFQCTDRRIAALLL